MSALLLDIAARHFDPTHINTEEGQWRLIANCRPYVLEGFSPNTQRHHVLTRSFVGLVR